MHELEGKVAIVTGAGRLRGIGRATAVALARKGCDVAVTGTGRAPAAFPEDERRVGWRDVYSVAEQVQAQGRRALPLAVDVTNSAQVRAMVEQALAAFGRVDILVNNAAYPRGPDRVPIIELDEAVFRRVLEVKVVGTFLCTQAVAPAFIRQGTGGRIINLSSTMGKRGQANAAAYAAANAAIHLFTQSAARELAPHGITVNTVCPGLTDTSRMDDLGREERWEDAQHSIPLGRAATDDEVGEFIALLCTDACSYITGQALNFNGGSVMEH
jgi:3-oxoacyl-[acyl-carrier protein] reductase/meso-butanediol dehydrogenase/(S,S)-butanediol dehydrogenase/diacetyl reductase